MTAVAIIYLLCKSMDWFLYDRDLRHEGYTTAQFSHEVKHPSIALVHKKEGECCKTNFR